MRNTIAKSLPLTFGLAIALFLVILPVTGVPKTWALYLFYFFIYFTAANMWNLLAGFSGLLALCPAAFIGLAGYTMTILTWLEIPYYIGILAGGVAAALFALLISISVFRMRGVYFAIGTLVVPAILRLVFLRWRPVGGGLQGGGAGYMVKGAEIPSETTYWLGLFIALLSVVLIAVILRSKFGLGLAAIRDNDTSAASSGINVFQLKLYSFLTAAFMMGMAGAIFYANKRYIEPNNDAFDISWLMIVLLATVIGGKGMEFGPMVGAIIVVALRFQLARYAGISMLIQGVILVVLLLAVPQGITGLVRDFIKARRGRHITSSLESEA